MTPDEPAHGVRTGVEMMTEKITTASAWGAVASPLWLPTVGEVSQICATWAPILGVAWLLFQFGLKIRDEIRGTIRPKVR